MIPIILCSAVILIYAIIDSFISKDMKPIHSVVAIFSISIILNCLAKKNEPVAMDVYRDNITLKITYKDSVPIDSIVVFK